MLSYYQRKLHLGWSAGAELTVWWSRDQLVTYSNAHKVRGQHESTVQDLMQLYPNSIYLKR